MYVRQTSAAVKKTAARPKIRVPFDEAVKIAGSVERVYGGRDKTTRSQYRHEGVPASYLAPFLLEWWRHTWKPPEKPSDLRIMLGRVEQMYGTDGWARLEMAMKLVEERPPRKERRRAAG